MRWNEIVLCLLFGFVCYSLVVNITLAMILCLFFSASLFFIIHPALKKVQRNEIKIDEISQLMHSIIIQLGATPSLYTSLVNIKPYLPSILVEKIQDEITLDELVNVMKEYYANHQLSRFLEALSAYDKQGGDFMALTELIVGDVLYTKYWLAKLRAVKKNKLTNLLSLWGLSFIVLIYLRVGLKVYYLALMEQSFLYVIMMVLIGFVASLIIAFQDYAKLAKEG